MALVRTMFHAIQLARAVIKKMMIEMTLCLCASLAEELDVVVPNPTPR